MCDHKGLGGSVWTCNNKGYRSYANDVGYFSLSVLHLERVIKYVVFRICVAIGGDVYRGTAVDHPFNGW